MAAASEVVGLIMFAAMGPLCSLEYPSSLVVLPFFAASVFYLFLLFLFGLNVDLGCLIYFIFFIKHLAEKLLVLRICLLFALCLIIHAFGSGLQVEG